MTQTPSDIPHGPVLVLCTHNAARSPMAEAFLNEAFGESAHIVSAGIEPLDVDPFAAAVMAECGFDLSNHHPVDCEDKALKALGPFTLIVALSRASLARAREIAKSCGATVEYWDVADPPSLASFSGSREQILDAYRAIRDDILRHIRNRFAIEKPLCAAKK